MVAHIYGRRTPVSERILVSVFPKETLDQMKKIVGVAFIVAAVVAVWAGLAISGVFFVIVGVSLIMDVRIWRP